MKPQVLSVSKAKEFHGLFNKKNRDREGLFIVEGEKNVADTLVAFDLEALVCTDEWFDNNSTLVNEGNKVFIADAKKMGMVSSLNCPPDVLAVFKKRVDSEIIPKLPTESIYVLLDEIQDPGNLGTIIRTCDWFGVYDIFASRNTVDVYSPKVVQATMGSLSRVKVHYIDLKELIEKNKGIKVIGAVLDGKPLTSFDKMQSGLLLLGNEGRGISQELKELIDIPLTIEPLNPLKHPDSLNVAVSAAIILSHLI